MVASNFKERLKKFNDSLKQEGSGNRSSFIGTGNTRCLVFVSPVEDYEVVGVPVNDVFVRNGKAESRTKFMFRALILSTDAVDNVIDGYENTITALVVPKTVMTMINDGLLDEEDLQWEPSEIKDGKVIRGTTFLINRTGSGLQTKYSVTDLKERIADKYDVPETVNDPVGEVGLAKWAEEYNDYQATKAANAGSTDDGVDM